VLAFFPMKRTLKKTLLNLTCSIKKDKDQYASLCLELDVASCGKTREEALAGLKATIETYVHYLVEEGRVDEISRSVPGEAIREFLLGEREESRLTGY
jgi:predicted RNase H-like HicB family nuclease